MRNGNPYCFQSDTYAYGIVLFEMTTGRLPYENMRNRDLVSYKLYLFNKLNL